jgi:succinoglycan biosynthesis transport protein ExoP
MAVRQPKDQEDFASEPHSVDLRDYWSIVRRRWRLIVLLALIGALGGAGYSVARGPSYTATAQVVVLPVTQAPLNQTNQATSQVNMSTEQAIAQSGSVIKRAAVTLKTAASKLQSTAASRLSVTVPASTLTTSNVLQITWRADSRPLAQQGANAFANAYLSYRHQELAGQISDLQSTLQQQTSSLRKQITQLSGQLAQTDSQTTRQVLNIRLNELSSQLNTSDTQLAALPTYNDAGGSVIPAVLNSKSSGFGRAVLVAIGLILGLLIGLIIAFARDLSDDRVHEAGQLERQLGAPVLAVMSSPDVTDRSRRADLLSTTVAVATDPSSYAAAAARVLRATVVAASARRDLRTLMVVAADASISAGLVVAELGLALAESGRRVLLVASDTQGSVLPVIFELTGQPGLIELLPRDGHLGAYTYPVTQVAGHALPDGLAERLTLLPSGRNPQLAVSALHADRIAGVLRAHRADYDFVVLDAPPEAGADILALASQVEGVIVLARQGRTKGRDLLALRHQLGQVSAAVVGSVLVTRPRRRPARRTSAPPAPAADRGLGPVPAERALAPETRPAPEARLDPEAAPAPESAPVSEPAPKPVTPARATRPRRPSRRAPAPAADREPGSGSAELAQAPGTAAVPEPAPEPVSPAQATMPLPMLYDDGDEASSVTHGGGLERPQ